MEKENQQADSDYGSEKDNDKKSSPKDEVFDNSVLNDCLNDSVKTTKNLEKEPTFEEFQAEQKKKEEEAEAAAKSGDAEAGYHDYASGTEKAEKIGEEGGDKLAKVAAPVTKTIEQS